MNKNGFTLIELMLVVIIIGILAAMVVPRFAGRTQEARIKAARADIESNLAIALDHYELDNGSYPTTEQGIAALVHMPTTPPIPSNWNGPYIRKGVPLDPWGNPYLYHCPGERSPDYDLWSYGPDREEGSGDDICNWQAK